LLSAVVTILKVSGTLTGLFLLIPCCIFLCAICFLLKTLKSRGYGGVGAPPNVWLKKELLEQDSDSKGYVLAHILYDYEAIISASDKANYERVALLDKAITTSVIAFLSLVIFLTINAITSNVSDYINFWSW
jgi:hypothetical protein